MTCRRAFDALHPAVLVVYALAALVLTMAAFQPVIVGLALASALWLRGCLQGWRTVVRAVRWQVPLVVLVAVANPLFSSVGSTELFRIGTHAVYAESFAYGLCMGALLVAVMTQIACASCVLTSDKIMTVMGNRLPTVSLMLSMALRLVPRFVRQGREIASVQDACTAARRDGEPHGAHLRPRGSSQGAKARLAELSRLASVLMGWSMEDSLETADAMRARGWSSTQRRTSYQRWRFGRVDALALAVVLGLGVLCAVLAQVAVTSYRFYPSMSALTLWWGYVPLALFFVLPLLVVLGDHLTWMR